MAGFAVSRRAVRGRLILLFILTVLATFGLIGRLAWIQIARADELYDQAWKQWNHNLPVSSDRGSVYDRNGRLLTGNMGVETIGAIPMQLKDPWQAARALAPALEMEPEEIHGLLVAEKKAVYIKRKVDPEVSRAVREMNIPGIIYFNEERRYYPSGNLASQLLGFVGMDQGWAGLEIYYDHYLSGAEGHLYYTADGRGRSMPQVFSRNIVPRQGFDLHLTIDETIQHIMEKELDLLMEEAAPQQAMALAIDPQSGAILAAASRPDYHPEHYADYDPRTWSLAPFTSSFEPGSTFKTVTLAATLEEGLFDPEEIYHCSGYTMVGGHRINCWAVDRGGHGPISYLSALAHSCNPAFIGLGERLGREKLFQYIEAFGFGQPTGVDYPGEGTGLVFDPDLVGPLELATTSFGQGVSVTPLQMTMAVTAMINGGYLYRPYLVERIVDQDGTTVHRIEPELVRQVVSGYTSQYMVEMMESVILEGTGWAAALEGYRAAAKTGTAQKVGPDGQYISDEHVYSIVGFAPLDNPRIVLFVLVDGVTRGSRYGSQTSAPLFKKVLEDVMNYLQVAPTEFDSEPGEGDITDF